MNLNVNFIPLSFITDKEEILKQIKNSVLFSHLLGKYEETTLNYYLDSTQYGFTTSASQSGTHKLLRITDINSGQVNWSNVPYCNCENDDKYLLKDNDILIARTGGTTGKSFCVSGAPENSVFASYLIRLRLKSDVEVDFINSFLNSYFFWSQIVKMKSGSAMPNVNAEKLKTLKLPKCDNDLQRAIAAYIRENQVYSNLKELFQRVDSIEGFFNNKNLLDVEFSHQLDLIKQLRQAFLREAMQGKLTAKWREENSDFEPASELLKKIKVEKEKLVKESKLKKQKSLPPIEEEEIPYEIPESWEWCRLGQICSKIGSGSTPKGSNYAEIGIPFFRSQNVMDSGLNFNDIKYISKSVHEKMNGTTVLPNDVLLNITGGSLGRCVLVPESFNEGNVSQHVSIIRPIKSSSNFIHKLILSPLLQGYIFSSTTGAGREGLPKYNLEQFVIPLPSYSEQHQIITKLDKLIQYCDKLEESIKTSQQQNKMLLQQVLREALETTI